MTTTNPKLTRECPHCFSNIDVRATVCPNCRREVKKLEPIKTKRRSKSGWIFLISILVITFGCFGVVSLFLILTSDNTKIAVSPTPPPTAPSASEIILRSGTLTEAQRSAYSESLRGSKAINWEGVVVEVRDPGELFLGYSVYIELDSLNIGPDVFFETTDSNLVISLNRGNTITFSGDIQGIGYELGETAIVLDNVSIEKIE